MALGFGFLHGLGFAGTLRAAGLPPHAIPLALSASTSASSSGSSRSSCGPRRAHAAATRAAPTCLPTWAQALPIYAHGLARGVLDDRARAALVLMDAASREPDRRAPHASRCFVGRRSALRRRGGRRGAAPHAGGAGRARRRVMIAHSSRSGRRSCSRRRAPRRRSAARRRRFRIRPAPRPASRSSRPDDSGSSTPGPSRGTAWRSCASTASASAPMLFTHFHSDHIGELGEFNLQTWGAGRARAAARLRTAGRRARGRGLPGGLRARHATIASPITAPTSCPPDVGRMRAMPVNAPPARGAASSSSRKADSRSPRSPSTTSPIDARVRLSLRLPRAARSW